MDGMTQSYVFFTRFARIVNSGQSRSVVLCGNIHDLFWDGEQYVPLIPFLCKKAKADRVIQLVYELNGPIRIAEADRRVLADAWVEWKSGIDVNTLALRDLHRKQSDADFLRAEFE